MSKTDQSPDRLSRSSAFKQSAVRRLSRHLSLPAFLVTVLLICGIGVMVVTRQPMAGLALILGVPVLVLLCTSPKAIVYALIVYSFVVKFLVSDIGFSTIANYVCDGLLLIALFFAIARRKQRSPIPALRIVGWTILAFWAVATLSAIAHDVSFGLYLWACRNTFRLFGILYCCVMLLDRQDIDRLIRLTLGFFFVDTVVCSYQHFVFGVGPDNTNGLFGTASGGNAMMNVLLFAVCAFTLFGFFENKYSGWFLFLVLVCSCYLAAIAELKVFYFELASLVVFVIVNQRLSVKMVMTVALIVFIAIEGIHILIVFNPNFADFFNLEEIVNYSGTGGYSDPYNLNRLTAVQTLDQQFMFTWGDKLFGLGFGAGQFSQFFASPLYAAYGFALDWSWFTDSAIFLETGYVGLLLYCVPFIFIAVFALKSIRLVSASGLQDSADRRVTSYVWTDKACASVALLCLLLIVYNCTLTTDPGCYFIGFILSFPFIIRQSAEKSAENNEVDHV